VLAVAVILVLAGLVLALKPFDRAPYPSQDVSIKLVHGKIIYTQASGVGDYPYMGMKILFRVACEGTSVTMSGADFGNQSQLSADVPATAHQVLMTSSWTNASINVTDSTGDGIFDIGDTIVFEMEPLTDDMVFTIGLIWTLGDGGGAIMEISFVANHGKLYAWYSDVLGDWYDSYLSYLIDQVLPHAVNYLCDNFNESTGLVCVSPDSEELENTYYIYSDNYLASLVLQEDHYPSNLTMTRMAGNITNAMQNYTTGIDPVNQYMVLTKALTVNMSVFNNSADFNLTTVDSAEVRTTQNNLSGLLDPRDYADIAFLQAIYYHELGMENESMTAYDCGVDLYDGKGFKDDAFHGTYQTYKLALYIYASKLLRQDMMGLGPDYDLHAFCTLLEMQQPNGGFATGYNSSFQVTTFTNTETTSLAVLSLSMR